MRVNMTKAEFVMHYASRYYDPVKAHEYYERTKRLKGRSTSGMSEEQKKAWNYVKNEVTTEKKQATEQVNEEQKASIEQLRSQASEARERISAKLKAFIERISDEAGDDQESLSEAAEKMRQQIKDERASKIAALPKIPLTASPAQKERLRAANAKEREIIDADAEEKLSAVDEQIKTQRSKISERASDDKSGAREDASQERKAVAAELKSAISSVRDKVKEIKKALASATEETLNEEYDNIMKNITGKSAKSGSKSGLKTSGSGDDAKRQKFIADNLAKLKSK